MLNRQTPAQPSGPGKCGNGGTAPVFMPAVCVHVDGSGSKLTLWTLPPSGYENVTVSPARIVTSLDPSAGFTNSVSCARISPATRGSPVASAGIAIAAARTASQLRCRVEVLTG
jgi:hypothetical protein